MSGPPECIHTLPVKWPRSELHLLTLSRGPSWERHTQTSTQKAPRATKGPTQPCCLPSSLSQWSLQLGPRLLLPSFYFYFILFILPSLLKTSPPQALRVTGAQRSTFSVDFQPPSASQEPPHLLLLSPGKTPWHVEGAPIWMLGP